MTKEINIFIILGDISEFHHKGSTSASSVSDCIRLNK